MLETVRAEAQRRTEERALKNKAVWDDTIKLPNYAKGDYVLVRAENRKKYEGLWYGPYRIHKIAPLGTYQLKKPNGHLLNLLISGDRLRRARVDGRVTRGWNLPALVGRPKRRLHGSENNPDHPIAAPIDQFQDLPEDANEDPDKNDIVNPICIESAENDQHDIAEPQL